VPRLLFERVVREVCQASPAWLESLFALAGADGDEVHYEDFFEWVYGGGRSAQAVATSGAAAPTPMPERRLSRPSLFDDIVVEGTVEGQRYRRLCELLGCPSSGCVDRESFLRVMGVLLGDQISEEDLQQEWSDAGGTGMTVSRLYTLLCSPDHYNIPCALDELLELAEAQQREHLPPRQAEEGSR
jgi:hypothetical protein